MKCLVLVNAGRVCGHGLAEHDGPCRCACGALIRSPGPGATRCDPCLLELATSRRVRRGRGRK